MKNSVSIKMLFGNSPPSKSFSGSITYGVYLGNRVSTTAESSGEPAPVVFTPDEPDHEMITAHEPPRVVCMGPGSTFRVGETADGFFICRTNSAIQRIYSRISVKLGKKTFRE
jgi:hypothetical protein